MEIGQLTLRFAHKEVLLEADEQLIKTLEKSIPLEPGYDEMAVAFQKMQGKPVKNLLITRRERCRGQFRPKKDRFEKWEKLDDLYFSAANFLHSGLPDAYLYREYASRFRPGGVAELTLELVNDMPWRLVCQAEDRVKDYDIAVFKHGCPSVSLKTTADAQSRPLDLRALYALAQGMDEREGKLAKALVKIGLEELILAIIPKNLLDMDTLDKLWHSGSIRILRKLLSLPEVENALTDEQAALIMAIDDYSMNTTLGSCANVGKAKRRISADALANLKHFIHAFRRKNHLAFLDGE